MSTPPASAVSTTPAPRRTSPTRFLLSTAALGAAGGILVVAINLSLLAVPPSSLSYSIYSATLGIWFLGPLVATALFRRPVSPSSPRFSPGLSTSSRRSGSRSLPTSSSPV